MGRQFRFKPWMGPLLVAVLVLPVSAAFVFLGPFFGLWVAGALAVAVVLAAVLAGDGPPPVPVRRRRTHRGLGDRLGARENRKPG
jgi:hypothetical protein